MRKINLICAIVGVAVAVSCSKVPAGLSSHWAFDEANGKIAVDDVAQYADSIQYIFNDRDPKSDPIRRKGVTGSALEFDGFSSFISRDASSFAFPEGSFSVSVWVAPRTFDNGDEGKLSAIINQQDMDKKQGFCLGMYRHGRWSFQMGDGNEWYEVWDEGNLLVKRGWSFLTAVFDSNTGIISLFLNGEKISSVDTECSGVCLSDNPLVIGKHNNPAVDGRSVVSMFNGLMDELCIFSTALSDKEVADLFKSYLRSHKGRIPELPYDDIKLDREKYRGDLYRPEMHANPPAHWMNEPHAPYYYNGKYHLTYQHNVTGPYWHNIDWGHWVSDDLVHWKDLPLAIEREENEVAPDGIWSGSATFDKDGVPVLVYTFGNWNKERNQGVALAFPKDKDDPELKEWEPLPHTTIEQQEGQGITGEFRDPFAWRDNESGKWYMLVGSGIQGKGGTAWAYESDNLQDWSLKGPFYLSNYKEYPFLGDKWELPVFLPLGKYPDGETRYILIVSPKGYLQNVEVYYWLGRFDKENVRFIPDDEEPLYWDYGGNRFIGPSGFIDPKGRALIFTVVGGNGAGWSGTCGFPSNIFLDENGKLGVKPIEELNSLRVEQLYSAENKTFNQVNSELKEVKGNMLEIYVEMDSKDADKFGIKVLKDPSGQEESLFYYDSINKKLLKDNTKSQLRSPMSSMASTNTPVRPMNNARRSTDQRDGLRNHFELNDETLKMHIYIDKALIQTYVNDRNTITTWAYPTLLDARGIEIFAEGGDEKNARA